MFRSPRVAFEFLTLSRSRGTKRRPDGELVELLWQDGAVVAHSQAQAHHHHHHHYRRPLVQVAAGNTGASGVTGEQAPALPWLPCSGGAMGGDVYSQLWQSIAQADGRVVGADAVAGAPRPPARSGNSGVGSSRTAGQEVGSSFSGSNLVAAAMHLDDDIDDVGVAAALPVPLDDPATATGAGAGASTSSGWNSNAPLHKRSRDEFDEVVVFLVLRCSWQWVQFRLHKIQLQFVREKKRICRTPTWTPSTRPRRRRGTGGRRPTSAGRAQPRSTTCLSG